MNKHSTSTNRCSLMHKYNGVYGSIAVFIECMIVLQHNPFINLFLLSIYAIHLVVNHILLCLIIKLVISLQSAKCQYNPQEGGSIAVKHFTVPLIETAELVFMGFDNITMEHTHANTHLCTYTKISMDRTKTLRCWLGRERVRYSRR